MGSTYCWGCLGQLRSRPSTASSRFTLTSPQVRHATPPKRKGGAQGAKFRESKNVQRKKSHDPASAWRRPVTADQIAMRRRIVLSNTNALVVPGIEDLSVQNMGMMTSRGQILGIPGPLIDQLRTLGAFKVTQNWHTFRRPAMLMRQQSVELGKAIDRISTESSTIRRMITGDKWSGKTVMLLQAEAMALLKGWIVVSIPEAQELTNGHTSYAPVPNTEPTSYLQKHYTAMLLDQITKANQSALSTLKLSQPPPSGFPIERVEPNISLARLAELGSRDTEAAWAVLKLLWQDLTQPQGQSRPPVLLTIDSISHLMTESAYRTTEFKPIHAHDLALVDFFLSYLSGARSLGPAGGMVLAATSSSNSPRVRSVDSALSQLLARQSQHPILKTLSPGPETPIPQPDPWKPLDARVMQVLTGLPTGIAGTDVRAQSRGVEVQKLEGLTREESKGLIEYFAKSGLVRRVVDEQFVGETWTLSGGGNVGEIEKAVLRLRV